MLIVPGAQTKIEIEYATKSGEETSIVDGVEVKTPLYETTHHKHTIDLSTGGEEWKAGFKYTYKVTVNPIEITFSAVVEENYDYSTGNEDKPSSI